jgi:HlyD family secretion protein
LVDFSAWVLETDDLTELEVVKVALGQSVSITLDALPDQIITGKVIAINPRYEDRRGDVTYTVTIALDNPAEAARWGMTGQVVFSLNP